ncbi:MAG TPA: TetR/AcrR family transcriptional regulator [Sandaracinaceae bacterium LLY-WYZ-13_1]|nr:TetR/AcrR family transcriptional regulator [Sandaracinaceae bacterium LLY-WYZ-13_1]
MPTETFVNLPSAKRRRIVELAMDEFARHPYARASLSRIVARAGIAKGSVYQYFDNKLDLYRWLVLEEAPRRKLAYLEGAGRAVEGDFFHRLEAFVVDGIELTARDVRLSGLLGNFARETAPEVAPLLEESRRRSRAYLLEMLRGAREAGSLRDDVDLETAADVLGHVLGEALLEGIVRRLGITRADAMRHPSRVASMPVAERRRMARQLVDVLRRGLGSAR